MQEIVNSKSDIVALQEIDRADFYEPALFRAGYSSDVNLRKYTNNCGNIAVAWKRDKIRIIAETPVRFDNLATTYNDKIYLKDYWGQLILFEDIATEKRFVVANCHLFWKP